MAFDIDEVFPWELAQKWVIRMQQLERAGFFEGDEYDLIIKHGQHNQKTHGSRYGAGQAKESLRRLKDDKTARERYKAEARRRGQGRGSGSSEKESARGRDTDTLVSELKTAREKGDSKTRKKILNELDKRYDVLNKERNEIRTRLTQRDKPNPNIYKDLRRLDEIESEISKQGAETFFETFGHYPGQKPRKRKKG